MNINVSRTILFSVGSHISCGRERNNPIRVRKHLPSKKFKENNICGVFELLQIEEAEPQRRVDMRRCANKNVGLEGGDWGIPHRLEEGNTGQQRRWVPKGVDCEAPLRLERRTKQSF